MPQISFQKKHLSSIWPLQGQNLMRALLNGGRPVASSCGGDGICGKCVVNVIGSQEGLRAPNEREKELQRKCKLQPDQRISCQSTIVGDVCVDTPYW